MLPSYHAVDFPNRIICLHFEMQNVRDSRSTNYYTPHASSDSDLFSAVLSCTASNQKITDFIIHPSTCNAMFHLLPFL